MLLRQLRRLARGLKISKLIVATSDDPSDDAVEALCRDYDFDCFRGPLNDVMGRFIMCARSFAVKYIIRVGGDDPLIDWECCNTLMKFHREQPHDFMYASHRQGWPYGCAAELLERAALEDIHARTQDPLYLEHTIPYFFHHSQAFQISKICAPAELNRPDYYFTVDYAEDLELIRSIFRKLENEGPYFELEKVIALMDATPALKQLNNHLHEGFER